MAFSFDYAPLSQGAQLPEPDSVDMLVATELTQDDRNRLARLKHGRAHLRQEVQAGKLFQHEADEFTAQIDAELIPLQEQFAASMKAEKEATRRETIEAAGLQATIANQQHTHTASSLQDHVHVMRDPRTGMDEYLYVPPDGGAPTPVFGEGGGGSGIMGLAAQALGGIEQGAQARLTPQERLAVERQGWEMVGGYSNNPEAHAYVQQYVNDYEQRYNQQPQMTPYQQQQVQLAQQRLQGQQGANAPQLTMTADGRRWNPQTGYWEHPGQQASPAAMPTFRDPAQDAAAGYNVQAGNPWGIAPTPQAPRPQQQGPGGGQRPLGPPPTSAAGASGSGGQRQGGMTDSQLYSTAVGNLSTANTPLTPQNIASEIRNIQQALSLANDNSPQFNPVANVLPTEAPEGGWQSFLQQNRLTVPSSGFNNFFTERDSRSMTEAQREALTAGQHQRAALLGWVARIASQHRSLDDMPVNIRQQFLQATRMISGQSPMIGQPQQPGYGGIVVPNPAGSGANALTVQATGSPAPTQAPAGGGPLPVAGAQQPPAGQDPLRGLTGYAQ